MKGPAAPARAHPPLPRGGGGSGQARRGWRVAAVLLAVALTAALTWWGLRSPEPGPEASDREPVTTWPPESWNLRFADEFDGDSVDWSKWADHSSAEADDGRGNGENDQLEWNQAANCSVADGVLRITARPDNVLAPSGNRYAWSSCLLSSSPSFAFRFGYMEIRAKFPEEAGFWSAFWTWQAADNTEWTETDVYEFYSHEHDRLHLSQHSGDGGGCELTDLGFDPTQDFHTYGAHIKPSGGTDYYIDGRRVCHAPGTSTGPTNVLVTMFVDAKSPPEPGTSGTKEVDYVRVWQP